MDRFRRMLRLGRELISLYMLWFNFILGLNFISLCFKLIIIHYHTQKQREIKFKPRMTLDHNIYIYKKDLHFLNTT